METHKDPDEQMPTGTGSVPAGDEALSPDTDDRFPIIGIGASAGGLAAFEAFFSTMPSDGDPGMAFVLVQHLARDHKSILSELIGRYTKMKVLEVEDHMVVEPNCAYIIPPNRDMALVDGVLRLHEPSLARGVRLPIDFFFRSLAQDQRDRAVCIVLSGTGSDGSLGVRAVKGEGGMVMAQTPETTEYDGMPRSAIATGMVDFVLPPHEMPAKLLAYTSQAFGTARLPKPPGSSSEDKQFQSIFFLLRSQTGHDFTQYKRNTIRRRVERRMAVHQIERIEEYVRYLELTPAEVQALFRDLLIGVTNFFRDADIFNEIQRQAIPRLFSDKSPGSVVRVWVAGCSTGEEAYSLAILLREHMTEIKADYQVTIFATDLDRESIERARAGIYPASIIADVSPERLAQYFEQEEPDGTSYRIRKNIRDMLIFSEHDITKDPPFSKLDLISCRNLLIYMGAELQKRMLPLFHYALNQSGVLVLGSSESVGEFANLFTALDRKSKIYQRTAGDFGLQRAGIMRAFSQQSLTDIARHPRAVTMPNTKLPLHEIAMQTLLVHYSPVGALVNEHGDILYLLGRTGRYLEPTPGEPNMNIFKMAREGLRGDLTIALHRAILMGVPAHHTGLRVRGETDVATINLTVLPASSDAEGPVPRGLFLVIIEELATRDPRASTEAAVDEIDSTLAMMPDLDAYIISLKQGLRAKDEYLQTAIEELETSNEELRSAHEEMQSVNEEMQSANEELETSKEELQSVNEELATVNSELQAKVADLSRSNSDMKNLLSGTGIGTVFVDHRLRVLRFTPSVSALMNLIESDVGRPMDQIRSNLVDYDQLAADVSGVLESLVPKELEVLTKAGEWFLLRIRPYRTLDNVIEGAVITFTDISALKRAQAEVRDSEALRRLAIVVRDARDAMVVHDLTGRILAWNPSATLMYGWSEEEALARNIRDIMPEAGREAALAELRTYCQTGGLNPQRTRRTRKDGKVVEVSLIAAPLVDAAGEIYAIATTERDYEE